MDGVKRLTFAGVCDKVHTFSARNFKSSPLTWTSQNQTGLNLHVESAPTTLLTQVPDGMEVSNGN
jgi:hypothetical protein